MDIDHFKTINDTYGHQNGDSVLRCTCERIEEQIRSSDALGRYGGEEFMVILPETNLVQAEAIAERLRKYIAEMAVAFDEQTEIRLTVSIGVSTYPKSADEAEMLVHIADKRLYKAKTGGRNRVVGDIRSGPPPLSIIASEG
jgi:diguanylate cyclase (GGDEF)-like protein